MKRLVTVGLTAASVFSLLGTGTAGAEQAEAETALRCGGGVVAVAGRWTEAKDNQCSIMGSAGLKVTFTWSVQPGTRQRGCAEAMSYPGGKPTWASLGCGTSGKGTVAWGNVLANPKIRVMSTASPLANIEWGHTP